MAENNSSMRQLKEITGLKMASINQDNYIPINFQCLYLLSGALFLVGKSSYYITPVLLFFILVTSQYKIFLKNKVSPEILLLSFVLITYASILGISILSSTRPTINEFERGAKYIFLALLSILISYNPPRFKYILYGFAIGAFLAGIRAIIDKTVLHLDRALAWFMPIQGGDISMSLGILSLVGLIWAAHENKKYSVFFFLVSSLFGILGSILSESRGGWILFPIMLYFGYKKIKSRINKKIKLSLIAIVSILIIGSFSSHLPIKNRMLEAQSDISAYVTGTNKNTSVGLRLELWKSALDAFTKKPLFGWNNQGISLLQKEQYEKGLIIKEAYEMHTHSHNQFLNELSRRGIIGFFAFILLLVIPYYFFKKNLLSKNSEIHYLSLMGICIIGTCIDYSLSQSFFEHSSGVIFYCFSIILIYNTIIASKSLDENKQH